MLFRSMLHYILLQLAIIATVSARSKCFLPFGVPATYPAYQPCSDDPSEPLSNICCQLNLPNLPGGNRSDGPVQQECLPNGLCQERSIDGETGMGHISWTRGYCTSSNFGNLTSDCLNKCFGVSTMCLFRYILANRPHRTPDGCPCSPAMVPRRQCAGAAAKPETAATKTWHRP